MNDSFKCKYQKLCGGCNLLKYTYEETLNLKLKKVNDCLKKEGIKVEAKEIVASPNKIKYRNKMIVGFKNIKGKIIAGFYEEGSHRIVDMDYCPMHPDNTNKILKEFIDLVKRMHIEIYDEDRRSGILRYLLIREAFKTKDIMVVIVTASDIFPSRNNLCKALTSNNSNIKTIVQNVNSRKTSIVLGDKLRVLYGPGFIYDYIGDIKFKLGPKSFFQVNPLQALNLYNEVKLQASLKGEEKVIDAYSGVGTIGCFIAKDAKNVICVENNKEACIAAIENIKDNNIRNVKIINGDATIFLEKEARLNQEYDLVILDPPRIGSTSAFIHSIKKVKAKKVIYVSCGPDTLARDLKEFIELGYMIKKIKCFDMFCFSEHIETVVCLERK